MAALAAGVDPIYIAHRGSAALYPEETYVGYDNSVATKQVLLEGDVQTLRDGTLVFMHDDTVERTTSSAGTVASMDAAQWSALRIDANGWHGSGYGNDLTAPRFDDWVVRYKGKALLVPEDKDGHSMAGMIAVLAANQVSKDQVLLQSFAINSVKLAATAGYPACYLNTGAGDPAAATSARIGWAGISAAAPDADTRRWVASGIKVLVWTVNRRYERDLKLALGVKGFFSDDPVYLASDMPMATTDRFALQTWSSGMFGCSGDVLLPQRGKFFDGDYWGYDTAELSYYGCSQGYMCPIKGAAEPKTYTIALNIKFEFATNNEATRWGSVFIGVDDRAFIDANEDSAGYHCLFRKNGTVDIFKKAAGARAVQLAGSAGIAIPNGGEASYRIIVAADSITLARVDDKGIILYSATANDHAFRGAYLQLGRNGVACKFRKISIT